MRNETEARKNWEDLGDTPVNEHEEIDERFLNFEAGTDIYSIWHWFEQEYDCSVATELMKLEGK